MASKNSKTPLITATTITAVILVSLLIPSLAYAQPFFTSNSQTTVFANPLTGISAPTASSPLSNIGQAYHLVKVSFPAEATTQAPIAVRLEWSRDGVNWRPAGPDITTAPVLNSGIGATDVVAFMTYYGAYRAIRINSTVATPGGALMTVDYIGTMYPMIPFATLELSRWVF